MRDRERVSANIADAQTDSFVLQDIIGDVFCSMFWVVKTDVQTNVWIDVM